LPPATRPNVADSADEADLHKEVERLRRVADVIEALLDRHHEPSPAAGGKLRPKILRGTHLSGLVPIAARRKLITPALLNPFSVWTAVSRPSLSQTSSGQILP
jgi:hypothetical protein